MTYVLTGAVLAIAVAIYVRERRLAAKQRRWELERLSELAVQARQHPHSGQVEVSTQRAPYERYVSRNGG